ncbi:MAG: PD-(D/E)XK nuclease superfamily protein [Dehalococcoidia bacterium]
MTASRSRDTRTGGVMEAMVLPALERGGYEYFKQVDIGERLGGGKHVVDLVAYDETGRGFLVSLKWQQSSGTAEQKVPFEAMCLIDAVLKESDRYEKAYLVLGGPAWTLREFYTSSLLPFLRHEDKLAILNLEMFVARANRGEL